MMGRLAMGIMGLGRVAVIGRRRVPSPAPSNMAFIGFQPLCFAALGEHAHAMPRRDCEYVSRQVCISTAGRHCPPQRDAGISLACVEHT